MKKIKEMTLNGRNVKKCEMGGGRLFMKDNYRYQEVEWIQQTAETSIESKFPIGVMLSNRIVGRIKFKPTFGTSSVLMGNMNTDANSSRFFIANYCLYLDYNNSSSRISVNGFVKPNITSHFEYGNRYIKDLTTGNTIVSALLLDAFEKNLSMVILRDFRGYFYEAEVLEDGICVRKLRPASRIADGILGVYDIITKSFYVDEYGTYVAGPPTGNHY